MSRKKVKKGRGREKVEHNLYAADHFKSKWPAAFCVRVVAGRGQK